LFLFKDKDRIEIPITCKLCLKELNIEISAEEYSKIEKFPFKREIIHGKKSHKLILSINKYLEIDDFEIEDILEKDVSYSKELAMQVLNDIGLTDDEVDVYFQITGRDAIPIGELALLIDKSKEESQKIATKFVQKGLLKEIVGAIPYYSALPPYAAMASQLKNFHTYITAIKENAPAQLTESFSELEATKIGLDKLKEYIEFILDLKKNIQTQIDLHKKKFEGTISDIEQIGEITNVIGVLEANTRESMQSQVSKLTGQFNNINKVIAQIIIKQLEELTEGFDTVKSKISKSLNNLKLGVIQRTVDQVVKSIFDSWMKDLTETLNRQLRIIQKVLKQELSQIIEGFNSQFFNKLEESLKATLKKINTISSSTSKTGENMKLIFEDVSKDFSNAVSMTEVKISEISETIFESIIDLESTLSTKVIDTLDGELTNILKKLEISEITTNEFWEQAKKVSLFTMKDIWFLRSKEGAKSHINDAVPKSKMRVLIVAPEISDIEIQSLKACRKHVNIRIAAKINPNFPEHKAVLKELDSMHNVSYRSRDLANLWGMHRDFEEVILCVLSETVDNGNKLVEIAGIGSIIPEHIKIFVPILEEAWLSSRKIIKK
jgi:predicted transcriptional regulator